MSTFNLEAHGITVENIIRNPTPARCYEQALAREAGTANSSDGSLIALSGHKTGRSPTDKGIVQHDDIIDDVCCGDVNFSLEDQPFRVSRQRAIDYLNTREQL